ncbi:hypothetical protein [Nitrobacter sp.]|uniref:hypothetical protein n=1 Tax=Nitrobacter sp. TaxID=29420 RepID=UPI0025EED2D0|nr:hypothetical protein [Nitrobacter sp.]
MADYANASVVIETVPPAEMGAALAADAAKKAKFGTIHLLIRGFLCTPFLAYGACVTFAMVAAGIPRNGHAVPTGPQLDLDSGR